MANELKSGDDLSMTDFARRREDVKWLIASGGHLYLTVNGKRRMKLTPVGPDDSAESSAVADVPGSGSEEETDAGSSTT